MALGKGMRVWLFSVLLSVMLPVVVAAGGPVTGRVVLIVMGPVSPAELWDPALVNLTRLGDLGSRGLINVSTGGGHPGRAGYVTLGAGARARAPNLAEPAMNGDETWYGSTAREVMHRRVEGATSGSVVHLGAVHLQVENDRSDTRAPVGALGEALQRAGMLVAVFGNADIPGSLQREAVAVAMDSHGSVALGDVGANMVLADTAAPFGVRTNYRAVLDGLRTAGAALLVIHAGDVERAHWYAPFCDGASARRHLWEALLALDSFVGEVMELVPPHQNLWAVVPAWNSPDQSPLLPVIMAGPGLGPGTLSSPSTRRDGLMASVDVAPTILAFLGVPRPAGMVGRPVFARGEPGSIQQLLSVERRVRQNFVQRSSILQSYITLDILAVGVAIVLILFRLRLPGWLVRCLLALALLPLAGMVWPWAGGAGWPWALSAMGAVAVLLSWLLGHLGRDWANAIWMACGLITLVLVADLLTGPALVIETPFGYSAAIGARFYGLGNEYMGYLVGAGIIGSACLLESSRRVRCWALPITAAWVGLGAVLLAAPTLGMNVGGMLTAAVGAGAVLWLQPVSRSRRTTLLVSGALVLLVAVVAATDVLRAPADRGHLGLVFHELTGGSVDVVTALIRRKLAMNLRLLRWTVWTRALMASLGGYLLLCWRPTGLLAKVRARFPYVHSGIAASVISSMAALVFNDSGVVAAATAMIPATTALLCAASEAGSG